MNKLENILNGLRDSPYVREKKFENGISSFNFTRKAFQDKCWTNMSIKARGLFIDTINMRIKARSYDKFFTVDERRETEWQHIKEEWTYPITAYVKENGYLGICSWNIDRTLFCASKSSIDGIYAERFREILEQTLGYKTQDFCERLRRENLSAIFEVIDPENDRHIIEYDKPQVILLDLVYNEWEPGDLEFLNKSYEVLQIWGAVFNLPIKRKVQTFWSAEALENFYQEVTSVDYKYHNEYIEGFVLEDSDMRHVKIKTDFYNYWKCLRSAIPAARKGTAFNYSRIDTNKHPYMWNVLALIAREAPAYYDLYEEDINIIDIRNKYERLCKGPQLRPGECRHGICY